MMQDIEVPSTAPDRARPRVWPWIVGALVAVVGGLTVVTGVFATQALAVRADLTEAKTQLATVMADIGDAGGVESVAPRVERLTALTERARATVDTPLWALFSRIPAVGQNVAAVRDVTAATDILVHDALPVGLQLMTTVDVGRLALEGGGIDLAPFAAAQSSLPELDDAFARAQRAVAGIDRSTLLPVVDESIGQVLDAVTIGAPAIATLEQYLPTLLQMAGSEGPRRYLVIFQNLAEFRSTGGNPAATMLLTVDGGRMSMSDQQNSLTLQATAGQPYLDLPAETTGLYEDDTFSYEQNFTRTPDFPTTAQLFRSLWQRQTGQDVDGVISVDPVVLSMILGVTGPVALGDGSQLTSDNAVRAVLSDAYERFGQDLQGSDAYFAEVASAAFGKVTAGQWDPLAMYDRLAQAARDQRVYLWFAREGDEAVARAIGVDGSLAEPPASGLEVGVFLNDSGYDKLGFYLSSAIQVTCDVAARTTTTTISVANAVPSDDLSSFTLNARAPRWGHPRTTMFIDVLYVAPHGSGVLASDPATGDLDGWDRTGVDSGRQVWSRTVAVPMGESRTVSYTSSIPDGATGPVSVRHTPGIGATPVVVEASCDALTGP